MLVAAAAMTFASCQKEEMNSPKETISTTLTLNADVDATKTYLGEDNTVLWGKGEAVTLSVKAGNADPQFINSTATDAHDGLASAAFTFNIQNVAAADSYTLGGVYPASASQGISNNSETAYKISLPATQNASVGKYDPSAFIMVLKPETVQTIPSAYTASFRRAVALNKITLTNVKEEINSVEITVPQNKYLAGRRYVNLTTGKSGEIYEGGGRTNVVKVNAVYPSGSVDVWFASWGVELAEGEKLTVKMSSDTKTYTRTIEARTEGIKFIEGDLNTLTINMTSAEEEVTEDLSGEYLIAAVPKAWNLMSGTNGGKYYSHVASKVTTAATAVKASDFYAVADIDACVWTVAKVDGGYTIKNNKTGKYVSYSGSSNEAYASTTAAAFALTQNAGVMTVESVAVAGRKLQYNSGSPRFAFYSSAQTVLYFIPWVADTTPRIFIDKAEYDVPAAEGTVDLAYSTNSVVTGNVTATVKTGATMTVSSVTVNAGKVTVNYAENTAEEAKTATIVLSYTGAESKEIVINQAAAQSGGEVAKSWVRVTSVNDLLSGGTFIIGYEATPNSGVLVPLRSTDCAATTSANGMLYSGTTKGSSGSGTITMSTITETSAYEVTITASTTTQGAINIKLANGNYIGNSGSKNTARLYANPSKNTDYTPTMSTNNVFTLKSPTTVSTSYTTLQYNSSSPRFCNYGDTQKNVVIYKYQ